MRIFYIVYVLIATHSTVRHVAAETFIFSIFDQMFCFWGLKIILVKLII